MKSKTTTKTYEGLNTYMSELSPEKLNYKLNLFPYHNTFLSFALYIIYIHLAKCILNHLIDIFICREFAGYANIK